MTNNSIELRQINKSFGSKQVLKDVNLSVSVGTIYGLLGPSGCGKTTTVKIIAGISEATSGEALVLGGRMPDLSLMGKIGYMAQSDALYTVLTARDNLEFFGSIYGIKRKELTERIEKAASVVNLEEELEKTVGAYSGGMKRRLSLAAALLHEPKILVLDEPTVGIDPLLRAEIWKELRKMAERGVTILVTTHVMDEAEKCDQLAMMRDGVLLATGSPERIIQRANGLVAAAVGTAGEERPEIRTLEEAFILYGQHDEAKERDGL